MLEIRRLGPQIGVEVAGVDVKTLDDRDFAAIYQAWLDSNVLVVRDQESRSRIFSGTAAASDPSSRTRRNRRATPICLRSQCSGSTNSMLRAI
jgi:alpha-ketoglutarate-dependent taurine dioxygenase